MVPKVEIRPTAEIEVTVDSYRYMKSETLGWSAWSSYRWRPVELSEIQRLLDAIVEMSK